jgi:hypothetical protein
MKGPNGTVCLSSDLDKEQVVRECERRIAAEELGALGGRGVSAAHDAFIKDWLDSISDANGPLAATQPRAGRRVNITGIHVHTHTRTHTHTHTHIHIHIHIHIHVHAYIYIYMDLDRDIDVDIDVGRYTCIPVTLTFAFKLFLP